jgi:hypothetical protein
VYVLEVPDAVFPVLVTHAGRSALALPGPGELLAAVPANIRLAGSRSAIVERALVAREGRT